MRKVLCFVLVFIFFAFPAFSQSDSIQINTRSERGFLKKQVLPIGLLTSGTLLNIGSVKNKIQNYFPNTHTKIDDYFQYAPNVQLYLYDALGFEHKNSVFDQTKYLVISQLSSFILTQAAKGITNVQRPVGGKTSFPSGHTTTAFVGATVIFYEFKDTEPLLAYSGYVLATATGFLRLTNDKHWLPDVLVGAGVGILITNLVYHFKPLKNFQPFKKKNDVAIAPLINVNSIGFVCRF
jgi:membrane-associated phospholipid phosphatase